MERLLLVIGLLSSTLIPMAGRASDGPYPNLVPKPASFLSIGAPDTPDDGEVALRFDTIVMNVGDYAFDLLTGSPRSAEDLNFIALQCAQWDGRICQERRDIGDMYFDSNVDHLHFHFADFARYELRRVIDGQMDSSPDGLVAQNVKESFCMEDTEPIHPAPLVEQLKDNPPFYVTCDGILQGITPGYEDDYPSGLNGQQVIIDGVPDGTYALVTIIDPSGRIYETNDDDNRSITYLRISGEGTKVESL